MSAPIGPGLVSRRLRVAREDVAWARYLLEAHDNLGSLYSDGDGWILLIAPEEQADRLDELVRDYLGTVPPTAPAEPQPDDSVVAPEEAAPAPADPVPPQ